MTALSKEALQVLQESYDDLAGRGLSYILHAGTREDEQGNKVEFVELEKLETSKAAPEVIGVGRQRGKRRT